MLYINQKQGSGVRLFSCFVYFCGFIKVSNLSNINESTSLISASIETINNIVEFGYIFLFPDKKKFVFLLFVFKSYKMYTYLYEKIILKGHICPSQLTN